MKRLTNIYPVYVFGREIFVHFDHFTANGQAVYNVEFLAVAGANNTYLVRYSGVKAVNQEQAARIAFENYKKVNGEV